MFWIVSRGILYHSLWRTSSSCLRDDGGGNLLLTLLSKTDKRDLMILKSGDCAGQGRCLSASSCSSNQDLTLLAVCMAELSSWKVGFLKILSDWFCGNRVFRMNTEFCCHLCCSSSITYRHNPLQSSSGFQPPFLSADEVFPWSVYAVTTLGLLLWIQLMKWPFWLQMLQLNVHQQSVLFKNLTSLPFCSISIRTVQVK